MARRGPIVDASYSRGGDSRRGSGGRGQLSSSSSNKRSPGYVEFGGRDSYGRDSYGSDRSYGNERRNGNFLDRRRSDLDSTRDYYGDDYRRDQRYGNNYDSRYNDGYGRRGRGEMLEYDRYGNRKPKVSKTILGYLTSYSLHLAFVLVVLFPLIPEFLKSFPK